MSIVTHWYEGITYYFVGLLLLQTLDKLGKGIVLREMVALFASIVTLLMPVLGYLVFNEENLLARSFFRYMRVPELTYFSFALPAVAGFTLLLCWPVRGRDYSDEGEVIKKHLTSIRAFLENHSRLGLLLVLIGVAVSSILSFLPSSLFYFGTLFYFSSFAGILYVYFSPVMKFRKWILLGFTLFTIWYALRSGVFTVVAYMSITISSFIFMGKRISLFKKLMIFFLGFFILLIIQSVKQQFRKLTWDENYQGNKSELFTDLVLDKLTADYQFFSKEAFFPIYYRANQGLNVSLVMKRIPAVQPFDGGVNLSRSLAASVVPRILWPDKPEAGGKFNMKFYTGINILGWSTNVGPLGEAYGSFGVTGGIIFMMVLGMFIRWAYKRVFIIARNIPLLICWLPVLFYQVTYSAETDTLQILNSLVKSAVFIWMLYK
ncbi:MAG TPA: hypothetical protein VFS31_16410, partial [Chitinophagaceae bacterium]|nr:hypothetical protein [Chitinophagaceae bacterium]